MQSSESNTMWKLVPEFNTYEASDEGFVRNIRTGTVLKNSVKSDGKGTPVVSLVGADGKVSVMPVRHVIYCTFNEINLFSKPKPKLKHVDGNIQNCKLSNLEIQDISDLEGEIWKDVVGFEGVYAVSNTGRVKRLPRHDVYFRSDTGLEVDRFVESILLKASDKDGYLEVNLVHNGNSIYRTVHRLVAEAFILNPDDLPQINHIDGNKTNNNVENLEWCTSLYNVRHSLENELRGNQEGVDRTVKKVKCIDTGEIFDNLKIACEKTGLSYNYLNDCILEKKPCHGMMFEYLYKDRRVKCLDTGQIFSGCKEAEREMSLSNISSSIKNKTCVDGWTFCYTRDNLDEEAYLQEARQRYSQWPRANKRWEKAK